MSDGPSVDNCSFFNLAGKIYSCKLSLINKGYSNSFFQRQGEAVHRKLDN